MDGHLTGCRRHCVLESDHDHQRTPTTERRVLVAVAVVLDVAIAVVRSPLVVEQPSGREQGPTIRDRWCVSIEYIPNGRTFDRTACKIAPPFTLTSPGRETLVQTLLDDIALCVAGGKHSSGRLSKKGAQETRWERGHHEADWCLYASLQTHNSLCLHLRR